MKDNRSKIAIKLVALQRATMWYYLNQTLNLVLVSEFPKSGGSWLGQMLSTALNIPFPRNQSPNFEKCLMHGHYLNSSRFKKVICVMRDGRDVMVSAYFHFLFEHDRNPTYFVNQWRRRLNFDDFDDVEGNLPAFINFMFTSYKVLGRVVTWADFVNSYTDSQNSLIIKYEDLLLDPISELSKSIEFLGYNERDKELLKKIADEFSFKNMSNRNPGVENKSSFLRKGIAGDWKNYFTDESIEVFDKFAKSERLKLGYTND